jgi:hypothetical protein
MANLGMFLAENFWLVLLIGSGLMLKRYRPGAILLLMIQIGWGRIPIGWLLGIVILSVLVDAGIQIANESDKNSRPKPKPPNARG